MDGKAKAQWIAHNYPVVLKTYGGFKLNGETWHWDYARQEAVSETEMKAMHNAEREQRKAASEKAKWAQVGMNLEGSNGA